MVRHLVQTDHVRSDDLADRPGIDLAVGVAADAGVHRAVVHAGAATDAVERLAQLAVGEGLAAAVVQQDQVHFLRTVQLMRLARAGDHVDVGSDGLAQRGAGQQGEQRDHVAQILHHLLDTGDGDVHRWHGGAHAAVAFVFHQQQGAGFGYREVHAGDADIGLEEFLPQRTAADLDELVDILGVFHAELVMEQRGDLAGILVNGRHDDVGRLFVVELDDVLAHVRFQALDPVAFEEMVHLHFFADHRFALDHLFRLTCLGDREDDVVGLLDRLRPVHFHTVAGQVGFQSLQQFGQLGQGAGADMVAHLAQALALVGIAEGRGALGHQRVHGGAEVASQLVVLQGLAGAGAEVRVAGVLDLDRWDALFGVHRAPPVRCQRKLARCWPRRDSRCFSSEPLMFIRQPQSALTT